jgi:hypothetical protein
VHQFVFLAGCKQGERATGHLPRVVFEIAVLLIAYAVLGAPLGFAGSLKNSKQNAQADK